LASFTSSAIELVNWWSHLAISWASWSIALLWIVLHCDVSCWAWLTWVSVSGLSLKATTNS
jgi:hypothetical protein